MRSALLSLALAALYLTAGGFAGNRLPQAARPPAENITVIAKNQAWPLKPLLGMDACAVARCIDI